MESKKRVEVVDSLLENFKKEISSKLDEKELKDDDIVVRICNAHTNKKSVTPIYEQLQKLDDENIALVRKRLHALDEKIGFTAIIAALLCKYYDLFFFLLEQDLGDPYNKNDARRGINCIELSEILLDGNLVLENSDIKDKLKQLKFLAKKYKYLHIFERTKSEINETDNTNGIEFKSTDLSYKIITAIGSDDKLNALQIELQKAKEKEIEGLAPRLSSLENITPFMLAVYYGLFPIIVTMLEKKIGNPFALNKFVTGFSALDIAKFKKDDSQEDRDKYSILAEMNEGNVETTCRELKTLLQQEEQARKSNHEKKIRAFKNASSQIKVLKEKGIKINNKGKHLLLYSLLFSDIKPGSNSDIKLLLEACKTATLEQLLYTSYKITPMIYTIFNRNNTILRAIIESINDKFGNVNKKNILFKKALNSAEICEYYYKNSNAEEDTKIVAEYEQIIKTIKDKIPVVTQQPTGDSLSKVNSMRSSWFNTKEGKGSGEKTGFFFTKKTESQNFDDYNKKTNTYCPCC